MPKLRHTWKRDKDFVPGQSRYSRYVCERCGCELFKTSYLVREKRFFDEIYYRDNRPFEYLPECIDWDNNTLD